MGSAQHTGLGADPSPAVMDQTTLVARAQDGDVAAFEQLVIRYEGRLYRYAYGMLGNRHDAEDVVQDTLIRVWRSLPTLSSAGAFGGWVYRIATRRCLDLLEQAATRATDTRAPEEMPEAAPAYDMVAPPSSGDPALAAEQQGQLEELIGLLGRLPPGQRACWWLHWIEGRSYTEIAQMLSLTEPTVRGRLARARVHLMEGMQAWR